MNYCHHCGHKLVASTPPHCTKCNTTHFQNPTPVAVAVTPVTSNGEIIGCVGVRRSATTGLGANGWALPGGYVELKETAQKAALRELEEETSLTPQTTDQQPQVIDCDISSNGKTLLVFVLTPSVSLEQLQKAKVSSECLEAGVLTLESKLTFSTHDRVLKEYLHKVLNPTPTITILPRKKRLNFS